MNLEFFNKNWMKFQEGNYSVWAAMIDEEIPECPLIDIVEFVKTYLKSNTTLKLETYGTISNIPEGVKVILLKNETSVIIISDIIRTVPFYYGIIAGNLILTDNISKFQALNVSLEIDINKLEEYIASGFVYGNGTIYKNVLSLQAGEIVTISDGKINSNRYFEYKPSEISINFKDINLFSKQLDQVFLSVFRRMIDNANQVNRWVIPLSGGHDSRIIVNYLYKLGIKNVVCFSYGISDNEQSNISKTVAKALGYEWHFVEYTEQKWLELHNTGKIDAYLSYAFNGVSTPHLQDFLAIDELKKNGVIKQGDIFLPGHTLDFISGGHFGHPDLVCVNKEMAIERTQLRHSKIRKDTKQALRMILDIYDQANVDPIHFQEYFNWQERQAKFIVNSIRAYEFFGFESRLPFWDKKIVDFWLSVPDEARIGRKIFFEAERNGILIDQLKEIPFAGNQEKTIRMNIENKLKKIIPNSLKNFILRLTGKKAKLNEGLNQIYALKAKTINELLEPVEDFPDNFRPYFDHYLNRYPFQMDYHFLTTLYTIRKELDKRK